MAARGRFLADGYGARRRGVFANKGRRRRFLPDGYGSRPGLFTGKLTGLVESLSLSVTYTATVTFTGTLAESFTASDSVSQPQRHHRFVADGYSIRATNFANKTTGGTSAGLLTETLTLSDALSAGGTFSGILVETLALVATVSEGSRARRFLADGYGSRTAGHFTGKASGATQRRNLSDFGGRIGSRQAL